MRTIIEIPEDVIESLDRLRALENRSRSAVIREAIDGYLRKKTAPAAECAFGLWSKRPKEGVRYQNEIRNDWDSE